MSRLSVTFFTDQQVQSTASLPNTVNTELIDFIWKKSKEAGYDTSKALAKAFNTKNPDKIIRSLNDFAQTGRLNPNYMEQLLKILCIGKSEIAAIQKRYMDQLYADEKLFIDNFDLLFNMSAVILGDTRYRNIVFHGIGIDSAWVSRNRPLTLGELYFHWKHNELVADDSCGRVYIFSASGSALSGVHEYRGYCPGCKKVHTGSRPTFGEILHPYFEHLPDFPFEATDCTVGRLVKELQQGK